MLNFSFFLHGLFIKSLNLKIEKSLIALLALNLDYQNFFYKYQWL